MQIGERVASTLRGKPYRVLDYGKDAVWLMIVEELRGYSVKVQVIERIPDKKSGGKWVDTVFFRNGDVSPIDGGICWER